MNPPKKLLTAEEICRKKGKEQKKKERKRAGVLAKAKASSAQLRNTSISDWKEKDSLLTDKAVQRGGVPILPADKEHNHVGPNGEWLSKESPASWNVQEVNVGWPWEGAPPELLTQAPYALNEHNFDAGFFKLPQEIQTSPLFNIPRGMEHPILQILFQHHSCASKFAATCQSAFNMVASNIHHWDFTRCEYNNCDNDPQGGTNSLISVGKIVVVSQFRVRKWRGEHFECEMYSLQRMTHAFFNFADRFKILHLHRIPFLTTHLLEMVVPLMTKLEVLGVYRCELLHLGDTLKLLEITRKNRKHGNGKTHGVKLDFYPRFHVGPAKNPVRGETRSYGVTWDNFGLDTRLATWQLLTRIIPQSKKQGADLTSKDSALRLYLDQSPCWRVADTIKTIERGVDGVKLAVQVNYPNSRGRAGRLARDDEQWLINKFNCRDCKQNVLGVFFDFDEFTQQAWGNGNNYEMLCLGCKLVMHLRFESDHRKIQKHHMVSGWLGDADAPVKDGDLEKALTLESKKKGMRYASRYERDRKEHAAKNLGEEMQKPRVENLTYSPSIHNREQFGLW